jgi:hypothetical protein
MDSWADSPICAVDIAASTTAVGRGMIMQLKTSSKGLRREVVTVTPTLFHAIPRYA